MKNLCVVILPIYNEETVLEKTVSALISAFDLTRIEILIVDDGSTDGTWEVVTRLSKANPSINGLRFSRNFGKESAIAAGLEKVKGDCAIVMDADMQHPPSTAVEMYKLWRNNDFEIVEGVKIRRQRENVFYKIGAGLFYRILQKCSGLDLNNASDFKLLDRSVIEVLKKMPERQTFFRAMPGWTGLRTGRVYFEVTARAGGKSKWSPVSLWRLAVDSITAYSSMPMQLVTFSGVCFFLFAIVMAAQTLYMKLSGQAVEGFTTVIVLLLLIGSILMISLGVIGIYIAKIYNEIKFRPRYIIADSVGDMAQGR